MRYRDGVIVVAMALCWAGRTGANDAGDQAVAAVERLGGMVLRDGAKPDKPVAEVSLFGNEVTDPGLKVLAPFEGLVYFSLTGAKVTDAGLKELVPLKGLIYLNPGSTEITDAGVKELAPLKGLTTLNLAGIGMTDAGLAL